MSLVKRHYRWILLALVAGLIALLAYGWAETRRLPVVRRISLPFPCCGTSDQPLRILLLSDIHVGSLGFSYRRLQRIVAQANALQPDIVVLAGDFVGGDVQDGKVPAAAALAPLEGLRAPLGVIAVLGNHDHSAGAATVRKALQAHGVTVVVNRAVRRGALTIGGVDDEFSGHADLPRTIRAMKALGGPALLLSHSPDVFPAVRQRGALVLAGHTHCGQIVLPILGAVAVPSRYGQRYACGRYEEAGKTLIVSGGTGFSEIPVRLGAPPEMWLITLLPPDRSRTRQTR